MTKMLRRSIEWMAQQTFASISEFTVLVMTLDCRNTQKKVGAAWLTPKILVLANIIATFYVHDESSTRPIFRVWQLFYINAGMHVLAFQ